MWRRRFGAQLLAGPAGREPLAVVERLLAVQGQDPRGARLAIRSRSVGVAAADIDRALTADRSLVISWLNRGTLHLVRSEDYPWLHALTTPQLATVNARRLAQEGVSAEAAERGVAVIERSLAADGPLTRAQIAGRLDAAGVPAPGQGLVHLLLLATRRGLVVRGPMIGGQHAFVLVRDWLPKARPVDRDVALAELARRYLAGHGPAADRDLAQWAGVPLRDARAGLRAIAAELDERPDGLLDLAARSSVEQMPPPRLLGAFDPVLLGWQSRQAIVGPHQGIVTNNGIFRPFALVAGQAAGIWTMPDGVVDLRPFAKLTRQVEADLAEDARDVARFLGLVSPTVRA